ncbi:MAG: hypothetical protein AAGH99_15420 [Planctomycetota bacterium]
MTPATNRSFHIQEEHERRLVVDLPPIEPQPEHCGSLMRQVYKHTLIAGAILSAVIFLWIYYPGNGWFIQISLLGLGFLLPSLSTIWLSLRVIYLNTEPCPQTLMITEKHLIHQVGQGWARLIEKIQIRQIRSVLPIEDDENDSVDGPPTDPVYRYAVAVIRWNFQPLGLAHSMDRTTAEQLAHLIALTCNRRIGAPVCGKDLSEAPVRLVSLDSTDEEKLLNEITRVPPKSKAQLDIDTDGMILVTIPANLANQHLSASSATAIILGAVLVPVWIIFFTLGPTTIPIFVALIAATALFALFALMALRSRHTKTTIEANGDVLTITQRYLRRERTTAILYDKIIDVTFKPKNDAANALCQVQYEPNKKIKLITGHREDELIWLASLLHWAVGLDEENKDAKAAGESD